MPKVTVLGPGLFQIETPISPNWAPHLAQISTYVAITDEQYKLLADCGNGSCPFKLIYSTGGIRAVEIARD